MKTHVIIPARYYSTRLPGKLLLKIGDKPIIQREYEQAQSAHVDDVIVATDDERIADCIKQYQGRVVMTSGAHTSGTERIGEVIEKLSFPDEDIVINLQGDEPFLSPRLIDQLNTAMCTGKFSMATLCEPLENQDDVFNPNVTKVLMDHDGNAIYFSRAAIPWYRDGFQSEKKQLPENFTYCRHIGIYAYQVAFIKRYIKMEPSFIEKIEALEQLRVLWYGEKIQVLKAEGVIGPGIDTLADLEKARQMYLKQES